jgi:hypothetical protein
MNAQDPLQYACADPDKCSCPNSKLFNPASSQSQHPHHPFPNATICNQAMHCPRLQAILCQCHTFLLVITLNHLRCNCNTMSRYKWPLSGQPLASQHATNCFPQPMAVNTVSYGPLADMTAATVNAPALKWPQKHANMTSGGQPSGNKKARTSATASTVLIATSTPASAVTASVVGVGPVLPAIDTAPTPQSSVVFSTPQPDIPPMKQLKRRWKGQRGGKQIGVMGLSMCGILLFQLRPQKWMRRV